MAESGASYSYSYSASGGGGGGAAAGGASGASGGQQVAGSRVITEGGVAHGGTTVTHQTSGSRVVSEGGVAKGPHVVTHETSGSRVVSEGGVSKGPMTVTREVKQSRIVSEWGGPKGTEPGAAPVPAPEPEPEPAPAPEPEPEPEPEEPKKSKRKKKIAGTKDDDGVKATGAAVAAAPEPEPEEPKTEDVKENDDEDMNDEKDESKESLIKDDNPPVAPAAASAPFENPGPHARDPGEMTKKLHLLNMIFLVSNLICMLAIVPSRSMGVGKWEDSTFGFFEWCHEQLDTNTGGEVLRCSGDGADESVSPMLSSCWEDHNGLSTGAGVVAIIAIVLTALMLCLSCFEFNAEKLNSFVAMQTCLLWLLWLLLLLVWVLYTVFAGGYNDCTNEAGVEKSGGYFDIWYNWGYVFYVAMWLVTSFFGCIFTMKAMNKQPPCGF